MTQRSSKTRNRNPRVEQGWIPIRGNEGQAQEAKPCTGPVRLPKTRCPRIRLGSQIHRPRFSHRKAHSQPYSSCSLQRTEHSKAGSPGRLLRIGSREDSRRTEAMTAGYVIPGLEITRGQTKTKNSTNPAAMSMGVMTLFVNEVIHTNRFLHVY